MHLYSLLCIVLSITCLNNGLKNSLLLPPNTFQRFAIHLFYMLAIYSFLLSQVRNGKEEKDDIKENRRNTENQRNIKKNKDGSNEDQEETKESKDSSKDKMGSAWVSRGRSR